jgi:hypothetical protein
VRISVIFRRSEGVATPSRLFDIFLVIVGLAIVIYFVAVKELLHVMVPMAPLV